MRAIVLFSGGLDSTVTLAMALNRGRDCLGLSFDYGQRHKIELDAAKVIAKHYGIQHRIIKIDPTAFGQSSLVSNMEVPKNRTPTEIESQGIPSTYVPARNTLFLAYALGQAEILGADEIYIGCNVLDNLPYPDCRPEFIEAFQGLINVVTKNPPRLIAPLINWDKKKIVQEGMDLDAPLEQTFSCYDPTPKGEPCHQCDACRLRFEAFEKVNKSSA